MTLINDVRDFAEGLARGFGLFIFERRNSATPGVVPAVGKANR